jgi:hypothetical protein
VNAVQAPPADPSAVWRVIQGCGVYWALVAAVRLRVFDHLSREDRSTAALAAACGAERHRLAAVLEALAVAGLIERGDDGWSSTPVSDSFLRSDSAATMADLVEWSPGWPANWEHLDAVVAGAAPPRPVDDDPAFYERLVRATFPIQHAVARAVAPTLVPARQVLELGAGAAPWSVALLGAWPDAHATVNDLPGVIDVARRTTADHGVAGRCRFLAGDYRTVSVPTGGHDLVVLGHLLRAESPEVAAALVRRAADALAPGGAVVVTDYLLDDDGSGSVTAVLLGLTMVANTAGGRAYTDAEITGWLRAAGLDDVTSRRSLANTDVLVARRAKEVPQ